jgi:hypothetical protein
MLWDSNMEIKIYARGDVISHKMYLSPLFVMLEHRAIKLGFLLLFRVIAFEGVFPGFNSATIKL